MDFLLLAHLLSKANDVASLPGDAAKPGVVTLSPLAFWGIVAGTLAFVVTFGWAYATGRVS